MAQKAIPIIVCMSPKAGAVTEPDFDSMKTIDEHIQKDQSEIQAAQAAGEDAKVRHLTEELHSLEEYKEHHPDDKHDPNALELFCDANPDEPECLVYDD